MKVETWFLLGVRGGVQSQCRDTITQNLLQILDDFIKYLKNQRPLNQNNRETNV